MRSLAWDAKEALAGGSQRLHFSRPSGQRPRKHFLHLVQHQNQGASRTLLPLAPRRGQGGVRRGGQEIERLAQRPDGPACSVASDVLHIIVCVQAGNQAGLQERGLADARLAAEEDERRAAAIRQPLVQFADLAAASKKDACFLAPIPGQRPMVGVLRQRAGGQRGQAEEVVAGSRRDVPGAGFCGPAG